MAERVMGADTWSVICGMARRLNRWVEQERIQSARLSGERGGDSEGLPGTDFCRRGSWEESGLFEAGWKVFKQLSPRGAYLTRPGKEKGCSATLGVVSFEKYGELLYVFSSNAQPFEAEHCYTKFAVYALLKHGGDWKAAARALEEKGYGQIQRGPDVLLNGAHGVHVAPPIAHEPNLADPDSLDATAADLISHNATIRWACEGWFPIGALTILAAEPGCGKTRLCADLQRRIYLGLPWPNGAAPYFPAGTPCLWVPADNQHPELGTFPAEFGFPPESLYLNATRKNPFAGTMLDAAKDLADFEARINRIKPAMVFIDTCLNATDRTAHKPEDAKAFFKPLGEIAQRTQSLIVCVTHLNAGGKPLGRRIEGQGRVVQMLEKPDPEGQPDRRKWWVKKSHSIIPQALGITMATGANQYDDSPPQAPEQEQPVSQPETSERMSEIIEWLTAQLESKPMRVSDVRTLATAKGYSTKSLYKAKGVLGLVEYEMQGYKWWKLTSELPDAK